MEKLSFSLRIQKEKFIWIWTRWTGYVCKFVSLFILKKKRKEDEPLVIVKN